MSVAATAEALSAPKPTRAPACARRGNPQQHISASLHEGLRALEIELLVRQESDRANGVSVCFYPAGTDASFLDDVRRYGVVLPGGVHPEVGGRTFRIGHLGNVTDEDVDATLTVVARARAIVGAETAAS